MKALLALFTAVCLAFAAAPASAEVVERHADGFTLRYAVRLETTAGDVVLAIEDIDGWWNSAHTYSGDAANLTLRMEPGGCLCEALADGKIFEHGRVTAFDDDHLALSAPLGPLKERATRADLTFRWPDERTGVLVTLTFIVEGPGLGAMADGVDAVMHDQYVRFTHYIEYGEAPSDAPAA